MIEIEPDLPKVQSVDGSPVETKHGSDENVEIVGSDENEADREQSNIYSRADEDDDEMVVKELLQFKKNSLIKK